MINVTYPIAIIYSIDEEIYYTWLIDFKAMTNGYDAADAINMGKEVLFLQCSGEQKASLPKASALNQLSLQTIVADIERDIDYKLQYNSDLSFITNISISIQGDETI